MIGIYKITYNNKVYIGQSINIKNRLANHKWSLKNNSHRNIYLQRAWNKNKDIFSFEIIECCINYDQDYLNTREIYWIDFYKSLHSENGFNLTRGGNLKSIIYPRCTLNLNQFRKSYWKGKHTDETKALISKKNKGKKYALGVKRSPEYIKKLSIRGKKHFETNPPYCINTQIFIYQHIKGEIFIGKRYQLKQKLHKENIKVSSSNLARLEKDSYRLCRGWKLIGCKLN